MRTALDTHILLDIFLPDPDYGPASKALVESHYQKGSLLVCDVVYAELASCFAKKSNLDNALSTIQVQFIPLDEESAYLAGQVFQKYRKQGGPRKRVIADFMIAAHAKHHADVLLTRDRGFYRSYFPTLKLVEP